MHRKEFLRFIASATAASISAKILPAAAESYPDKPIKIVVPFAAGGATDILARTLAEKLSPKLGQPVIVDNKTGAGGNIGVDSVAKSRPDGCTILATLSANFTVNTVIYKNLPYDPQRDFVLIAKLADAAMILVANAQLPIKNMADLQKYASANRGKLAYGSWGVGSLGHLCGSRLSTILNAEMNHVPYRGEVAMLQDIVGGNIPFSFASGAQSAQLVAAGRLKAIAVQGTSRIYSLPDVPTFSEVGFEDPLFRSVGWFGIAAPAGTPKPIIQRLSSEIEAAMQQPDFIRRIRDIGMVPHFEGTEEFSAKYRRDQPMWQALARASGASLD